MRSSMPRATALLALLLASLAASACDRSATATVPDDTPLGRLKEAQALWQREAPPRYRMTVRLACFCGPTSEAPVVIEIGGGTAITRSVTGDGSPAAAAAPGGAVEELFKVVQDAINTGAAVLDVEYNARYGYPSSIFVDPAHAEENDESSYLVIEFVAMS